jgi:OPA family glycerol-3-phosphate transporter-like MFS transporter
MSVVSHSSAYRARRFLNWFPLGLTYAFLYMGRYNLTVAKNSLGDLMTKEDFGIIFGAGTLCYAFSFLLNGPLVDRIGGRKGMLIGAAGSAVANLAMALYLRHVMTLDDVDSAPLRLVFSGLYAANMYFQSYGAVSIVKVNASWFHVTERGGFSGIFGTMISSGIFFAFTVNKWILDTTESWFSGPAEWVVFIAPAVLLGVMVVVEWVLLRDRPSEAGHQDFDTGDASSGEDDKPLPTAVLFKRILTNPIILTVAFIEFCTGVVRNGVMHWFPIYAKEIWVLPPKHILMYGSWDALWLVGAMFLVAGVTGYIASRATGRRRAVLVVLAALTFLAPFVQGGWGGLLFIAGVIGGNVAGWVSQLFFQSRRAPAAGGLYAVLTLCCVAMIWSLSTPGTEVAWAAEGAAVDGADVIRPGDRIVEIAGKPVDDWADVVQAVACWTPLECVKSAWDEEECMCRSGAEPPGGPGSSGDIPVKLLRDGSEHSFQLPDPAAKMRAGDRRSLAARPLLPISPYVLGALVFLISLCVIGVHGLLSGTATMDFGGRKGAATAVGVIDGFVYLGTAVQSIALGYLTTESWSYWPWFLVPFGIIAFLLTLRIWGAKPKGAGGH